MKVELIRTIPLEEILDRVRKAPLLSDKSIQPYKSAHIDLRQLTTSEFNPSTFYLVREHLDFQRELNAILQREYGHNTLNLLEGVVISVNGEKEELLIPPIVEVTKRTVYYQAQPGEINYAKPQTVMIPIAVDGNHRSSLAHGNNGRVRVIHVANANQDYPFYAHPNSWDEIKLVNEVPKSKQEKKMYLKENCYDLYRDFSELTSSVPRGTSK